MFAIWARVAWLCLSGVITLAVILPLLKSSDSLGLLALCTALIVVYLLMAGMVILRVYEKWMIRSFDKHGVKKLR